MPQLKLILCKELVIQTIYIKKWCAKMVSTNFQRTFFLFWHKSQCIVRSKKEKKLFYQKSEKTLIIQFPYMEIVRLAFLWSN